MAANLCASDSSLPSSVPLFSDSIRDYYPFISAQGLQIVEDETCFWVEKRKWFWESAPSHRRVRLSKTIAKKLFSRGALAIRYTCPDGEGSPTFEYIWDDKTYGLNSLSKDARRRVRKNRDISVFKPVDFELLIRDGISINQNVYARQNRNPDFQTDQKQWTIYMETCSRLPFVESYGVFVRDRLCAYSLAVFIDDYCYAFHPYAHSDYLDYSPMNTLTYSLVERAFQRSGVRCVCYGVESYTQRLTLDHFKISMGCRKNFLRRQIVVHPLYRPAFSNSGAWLVEKVLGLCKPALAEKFSVFSRAVRGIRSDDAERVALQ